jgi:COP9 signalosome complex subunit 7
MAASNKNLDYSYLMESLDLGDVRELEDLLIECIYAEIVVGRLDQQSSQLKVQRVVGRDPSDLDIANMCEKLERWSVSVDSMIVKVDCAAKEAENEYGVAKMKSQALKDQVHSLKKKKETEIANGSGSTKQGGGAGRLSSGASGWSGDDDMAAALAASRNEF